MTIQYIMVEEENEIKLVILVITGWDLFYTLCMNKGYNS